MVNMLDPFLIVLLISLLVISAAGDVRFKRIPNLVTYPSILAALLYHFLTEGFGGLLYSAGGLALGIALFIVPYFKGAGGAGDAKLMGATGAILGPKGVLIAFAFAALVGGGYVLILLLANRQYAKRFIKRHVTTLKTFLWTRQFIPIPPREGEKQPRLRYGLPIALGTLSYVFLGLSGYGPIV